MPDFLKNILWATDFSAEAQEALLHACFFAKTFRSHLTAVHVVPDFSPALYEASSAIKGELAEKVDATKRDARTKIEALSRAKNISFNKIIIKEGTASKKIIEASEEMKANLIVIGKKGLSALEKLFIGSVANQVLRTSRAPVLVTQKKKGKPQVKKILVPTDFSEGEDLERDFAWRLAKGFDASLSLLHVLELFNHKFSPKDVDEMMQAAMNRLKRRERREREDIKIFEDVTRAIHAPEGIVDYAEAKKMDLIVISTRAESKLERFFLGSTTEKVISYTSVPVFIIPPVTD